MQNFFQHALKNLKYYSLSNYKHFIRAIKIYITIDIY